MSMREREEVQKMLRKPTKYIRINPENADGEAELLSEAAEILRGGGLVAFPTETVYGLGANAFDAEAVGRIYEAKGRPSDNPLIVHIASMENLNALVEKIPDIAEVLMKAFWPGPLTLVFGKSEKIPFAVSGGLNTVAVRFPKNRAAQLLIQKSGVPVAAPSANSSGKPSPTRAAHVAYDLDGKIDVLIDGGSSELGLESTVLDISGDRPVLLRPGSVTKGMIESLIGAIEIDPALAGDIQPDIKPKAPGMKYKHYSPKAKVTLYEGSHKDIVFCINKDIKRTDKKVGVLASVQNAKLYSGGTVLVAGDREKPETIAANLFRLLRKFDHLGMDEVYSESFEQTDIGMAVMNRLKKAAVGRIRRCAVKKVIFVCSGNTCRSPMAEALAKKLFAEKDIIFASRGLRTMDGMPISGNARQALMEKYDIDFSGHQSASLTEEDLKEADLLLTMTAAHKRNIENEHPGYTNAEILMDYTQGLKKDVADPYGGSLEEYMNCAGQIQACLEALIKKEDFLC